MKKIKFLIASMIGAIALVFACVLGTRVTAASTQPYVAIDFSSKVSDGNVATNTYITSADSFTENGFVFSVTGGGGIRTESNGLRFNNSTDTLTFTTLSKSKVTLVCYSGNDSRTITATNDKNLNVTFKRKVAIASTTVTYETDKTYTYTNDGGSSTFKLEVFDCPATSFTVKGDQENAIYLDQIIIQPYLTVSFDTNGGTSIDSVVALCGEKYVPSTTPTKDGYTFAGWYTNEGLTDAYDSSVALTADTTLYAKWADASAVYDVTFMNGTAQYGDSISIPYDSNGEATIGDLMPTNPTKVGYEFIGWYTKDGSNDDWGTKISSDTTIDGTMVSNNSLTLYSKFNALATCVYSFGSGTIVSKQVVISDSITLKEVNKFGPDRTNTFNGNSMVKYCQCSEIDFVLRDKASVEIYATQTNTTANVSNYGYYIKDSSNNIIANSGYTPVQKPNNNATVSTYQTIVLPAGSYKLLSPLGVLNIYGMKIDYTTAASATDMTPVKFEWQFDDDINPTKVRFIGTLNGIEDLSKLSNMKVAMTIRNSYVDGSKTYNVGYAGEIVFTGVYKKVLGSGDTSKETAVDGVYYTVCTLTGIDEMTYPTTHEWTANWTIEAKLQYTYNGVDYSIQSSTIKDF